MTDPPVNPPPATRVFDQSGRALWVARAFVAVATLALLVVFGRVVQLQLSSNDQVKAALAGRTSSAPLMSRRGALYDRTGRIIASSHVGHRLFADPKLIADPIDFAAEVANAVGIDPAEIDQRLDARFDSRYVELLPLLAEDQIDAVTAMGLPGLGIQPRHVRRYPQGPLAGQVIGFVGADQSGLGGIEFALEKVLTGAAGRVQTLRDVRRRPLWIEQAGYVPPQDGYGVRLSIDVVIQGIADTELAAACEKYEAKAGTAVILDARTGQVLAMSNWPAFDPNAGPGDRPDLARNRCVTDPFEPGSIFKPFIWSVATANGTARPTERIDTTTSGLWVTSRGRRLRDSHPHGLIDWDNVLIRSSNIGMGKVGERMGAKALHQALTDFGFGAETGSALPGESPGIVNPLKSWTSYSLTSIPMGQEIATTTLQMARAFTAFANEGVMVAPSILEHETDSPVLKRVLDAATAEKTKQVLRRAVADEHGTGRHARSKLYRIWGKTGTAQVAAPDRRGYLEDAYVGSFICGAPLDDPRIVVIVTVHQPNRTKGYYGGTIAAPAAKLIVEGTLQYLRVPFDADEAVHDHAIAVFD